MKLLENTPFDITEYCGNLIITFLSEDTGKVKPLFDFLDKNGYEYIKNEIGLHTVLKSAFLPNIEKELNCCGCYILYLSEKFNKEYNRVLKNNIFYQVGYLEARRERIIVPFLDKTFTKEDRDLLAKTPLQQANTVSTFEEVLNTLKDQNGDRFRSIIMQNTFYKQDELNYLTRDRIEYRRLILSLNITKKDFKNAFDKYCAKTGETPSENEFINVLRDNLICGAKILSFGTASRMTTHLSPYADEMDCITGLDFPESFKCSHVYKKYDPTDETKADRKATYTLEIIVPIHTLLGVNFKSFIGFDPSSDLDMDIIEALFSSNFSSKKNDHKKLDNKIYFSINFPNAEGFDVDPALQIGSVADYLFPQ